MKTFPLKTQRAILRALIRHWWPSIVPCIAKAIILRNRYFTEEKFREVVGALLVNCGDLEAVKTDFRKNPKPWHTNFFAWADKVKGGAL
jgi:hypothetical protein